VLRRLLQRHSGERVLQIAEQVLHVLDAAGQADHTSRGTIAARKGAQVWDNVENVVAVELLEAAQALDFRKPLSFGEGTAIAHAAVRSRIPHLDRDRELAGDIAAAKALVRSGELVRAVESELGAL